MWLTSLLLIVGLAQGQSRESELNPFEGTVEIRVLKKASLSFNVKAMQYRSNDSSNIAIRTRLRQGHKANMVVLYGSQSESWILSGSDNFTALTLCHDDSDKFNSIHIMIHSYNDSEECIIDLEAKWEDIALQLGTQTPTTLITQSFPATYLVHHNTRPDHDRKDRFVLNVETVDDEPGEKICMIVAVYNKQCPLHNRPSNVRSAEMWTTALKSATLTIRADKFCFVDNFFVSVVVLPDDHPCYNRADPGDECRHTNSSLTSNFARQKKIRVSISKAPSPSTYVVPIIVALICMAFIVSISVCFIACKSYGQMTQEAMDMCNKANEAKANEEITVVNGHDVIDGLLDVNEAAKELCDSCRDTVQHRDTVRRKRIERGLQRLKERPTLADNAKLLENDWFRRNRSRVYIYLVPLISIYYFVPAIQFAFQAKENEEVTGSMDLCFHNFKCARPFWIFSDFNHVISNMSYVLFGFSFIILVFIKSKKLPDSNNPREDHNAATGLLQQLSIFKAMGFTLMAQGFFSVCYHVCPTNLSLQFDTTMMYIICTLCFVKLYQFRHPDATANAYSTFGILGVLVLLEAMALYSSSWIVYGIFLASYAYMTLFIAFDCYYVGVGRMDWKMVLPFTMDIFCNWKSVRTIEVADETDGRFSRLTSKIQLKSIKFPKRFVFAVIFCIVNFAYAVYIAYAKIKQPNKNVTHVVLNILAGNLFLYLLYYIIRKNCTKNTESEYIDKTYWIEFKGCKIPSLFSPGSLFAVLAIIFGIVSGLFYAMRSANRNLTPAESRNLNSDCSFLDFYDNHDMWHFFSAAGIYMAFLALLTVDDDLLFVPRDKIDVF